VIATNRHHSAAVGCTDLFIQKEGFKMAPRLALLSLVLAFGVSVAFATVTTVRQVQLAHSSTTAHAAHS
jgi:hypothetical protein